MFDTTLLIIRDADLWYDFVEAMRYYCGTKVGGTIAIVMQIVAGHEEGIEKAFGTKKAERDRSVVDREFMDNR